MLVRDLMEHDVLTLRGDLSIGDACDLFQQARVQGAPVVDEKGRLLGFVSQEDLLYGSMGAPEPPARATAKSRREPASAPCVRDIMTAPAVSATEETHVADLCRTMWKLRIHHVPIVRRGKVTGMVSTMDLCRAVSEGAIRV